MNRKKNDVIKNIDEISDIWETLTIDQKIYLRENCQIQNYRKNEIVYSEGEIPKHMICLVKGKVKIFKTYYTVKFKQMVSRLLESQTNN